MIHSRPAEHRVHCCLLPVQDCLQTRQPDSVFPLIFSWRSQNVNVGALCEDWEDWGARGGPCDVLMSGLSIMQYLMREPAEITDIFSTKLSTVVRNTLAIVPQLLKTCWCQKTCSILKGDRGKVGRLARKRWFFFAETITARETNHEKMKICTTN